MSSRFLLYMVLVGITYALYSFNAYTPLLFLLILMLALPVCSFLLLLISRVFVRIEISTPKAQVYRLEPFTVLLDIQNRGPFFFPLIRIEFNLPKHRDVLQPDQDWRTDLKGDSENVHFFNEYFDWDQDETSVDATPAEGETQRVYRPDRRKTFRLYPLPHWAMVRKIVTAVLPQRSTSRQEIILSARHKGTFEVGTDSILLQDLFGFFYLPLARTNRIDKASGKSRSSVSMEILPNPLRWQSPQAGILRAPEEVLMNARDLKVSNEVDSLANVRDFVPGDRVKQIHWKLSARSGKWLSREFEDPRQGGILFLLDPKLPDDCVRPLSYADEAPEILASMMRVLSRTEGPLNLLLGEDYYTAPGEGVEPRGFYRAMMHWKPQIRRDDPRAQDADTRLACQLTPHRLELSAMLEKESKRQRYRAIVVVTARMNDSLSNELRLAQKIGSQILLIFLHNEKKQVLDEMLLPLARSAIRLFPTRLTSLVPYQEVGLNPAPPAKNKRQGRQR